MEVFWGLLRLAVLFFSLIVLPIAFVALAQWLVRQKIPKPPFISLFILFGNIGGFLLIMALSPSGLAALGIVFLVFVTLPLLVGSLIVLSFRRTLSFVHHYIFMADLSFLAVLFLCWALCLAVYPS